MRFVLAGFVLLLAAAGTGCSSIRPARRPPLVELRLPAADADRIPTFRRGESVVLRAELVNVSDRPLQLSPHRFNIHVTSVEREGWDVADHTIGISTCRGGSHYGFAASRDSREVPPGGSLAIAVEASAAPGLACEIASRAAGEGEATVFRIERPGLYEATLGYHTPDGSVGTREDLVVAFEATE